MAKMNIVIPIGGSGKRFLPKYDLPKPLIPVNDMPMVSTTIKNLQIPFTDTLFIAYQTAWDSYGFKDVIRDNFPNHDIRFVMLKSPTIGAPDTLRRVLETMTEAELKMPVVSFDVDTLYVDDALGILKEQAYNQNAVLYFVTDEQRPLYSYVKLDGNVVTDIAEKVQISSNACSGAYKFESGNLLLKHINILYNTENTSNEKYTSALFKQLLNYKILVYGYPINGIECVGTPEQLENYQRKI